MSRFTITTTEEQMHRLHLAGPFLDGGLRELDNHMRDIIKYGGKPDAGYDGTREGLAEFVREVIREIQADAGVPN
jgi:hypothetical protein